MSRHSEEFFGDYRNFWWNSDFLELMAQRWNLNKVKSMLDVGCGVGHWGQLLAQYLPTGAHIQGVDCESDWVDVASKKANALTASHQTFEYQLGSVENLPFPDNSFDLVTCQTLLIHVPDPKVAILEMTRVLKPNGLLSVAEPNNLVQSLIMSNIRLTQQEILDLVSFSLCCERGKEACKKGNNSVGDLLPGYFSELGLKDIQVFISDKASSFFPPYDSVEQRTNVQQGIEWAESHFWTFNQSDAFEYFIAGGGARERFAYFWEQAMKFLDTYKKHLVEKTYHSAGGHMMYLVSGRKISSHLGQ